MLKLQLPPERGGLREFESTTDAIVWLTERASDWSRQLQRLPLARESALQKLREAFVRAADDLREAHKRGANIEKWEFDTGGMTLVESPIGEALLQVHRQVGLIGANAAVAAAGLVDNQVAWNDLEAVAGVTAFSLLRDQDSANEEGEERDELNKLKKRYISMLAQQGKSFDERLGQFTAINDNAKASLAETLALLPEMETRISAFTREFVKHKTSITNALKQSALAFEARVEAASANAASEISAFQDAHQERLRLDTAVKLWSDRANQHKQAAGSSRVAAICVGVLGFLITIAVAGLSFEGAKALFAYGAAPAPAPAIREGIVKSVVDTGLRPTFHYELLFAGAVTLAWLTLFLWTMRLIIRSYTSEHHLAVDASARSALTSTYFSLIQDQGATPEDRAIVLATLFRPVADGVVKDDGMPMLTPGAAVAALLSGKGSGHS